MKEVLALAFLLFSAAAYAEESCLYPSKRDGGSLDQFTDCGVIEGDRFRIGKQHAGNIAYDKKGLACILSPQGAFYLHKSGRSQRTVVFDNGCDYFEKGLASGLVENKMVLINEKLDIVLRPGFDWLAYHAHGHFKVCNGPFTEEKQGEIRLRKGGQCGLMDSKGNLVMAPEHRIEGRAAFDQYLLTHNGCPPPPVTTKEAALCHAKWHIADMDGYSTDWQRHEITRADKVWLITFNQQRNKDGPATLTLDAESAGWRLLNSQSHQEALREARQ